jgi:hypothetical protein
LEVAPFAAAAVAEGVRLECATGWAAVVVPPPVEDVVDAPVEVVLDVGALEATDVLVLAAPAAGC